MNLEIEDAPDGLILHAETCEPVVKVFNGATIEETEARLNLFAAAPDLLAALKNMVSNYQDTYGDEGEDAPESVKAALQAIAKAEGK